MRQLDNDAFTDHNTNIGKIFFFLCELNFLLEWVSELLLLLPLSNFQLFHNESKLIFNEMRMRSALY